MSDASRNGTQPQTVEWGIPQELPERKFRVLPMTLEMLPMSLRDWVSDIAQRMCVPLDFVAVSVLVVIASLIGIKIAVLPKRKDNRWVVVPNLYGLIVGAPGALKTPTIMEAERPLQQLEAEARKIYDAKMARREFDELTFKALKGQFEKDIRAAAALKTEAEQNMRLDALSQSYRVGQEKLEIICRRYVVNDFTVEKLQVLLNENPNGLLVTRDELSGLFDMMSKKGHENDRTFVLEGWDGNSPYSIDRIGRGSLRIPRITFSILGGMTPATLQGHLSSAAFKQDQTDGLIQRFQASTYPDDVPWKNVDRPPDAEAEDRVLALFKQIDEFKAADTTEKINGLPVIHFDSSAQELFDQWRDKLELRLRRNDDHPAIISHLAKYRSLMPTLALIFYLTDQLAKGLPATAIDIKSTQRSIKWCEYFESHMRRIYGGLVSNAEVAAKLLGERIRKGEIADGFTPRDVYRKQWSGLGEATVVAEALELLEELKWLRSEIIGKVGRGRAARRYFINPKVLKKPAESAMQSANQAGGGTK